MDYKEAIDWFDGDRSMTNIIPSDPHETWIARIAEADAAMMQQAYWFLKAHKEKLLQDDEPYGTCGFCGNDGAITKDPDGSICDKCWDKD